MAVETRSVIEMPGKFEKLRFSDDYNELSNTMSTPSTPSSTATTPPIGTIQLKYIDGNDTERVILFLRRFFFQDEPLNVNVKLLETPQSTCVELEDYSLQSIEDGASVMAINESSGDIVGVCLNGIVTRDQPENDEEECKNEKFAKILTLLNHVDREVNVFERYAAVDKILIIKIISVDTNCRGRGIAKILCDKAAEIAKEQGCGLIRIDCSSAISAKVAEKLGYECIYNLRYADYKRNGLTVFNPEQPHEAVKVYIKRVLLD